MACAHSRRVSSTPRWRVWQLARLAALGAAATRAASARTCCSVAWSASSANMWHIVCAAPIAGFLWLAKSSPMASSATSACGRRCGWSLVPPRTKRNHEPSSATTG
eukprot:3543882-Prymnesium_polylepis.1